MRVARDRPSTRPVTETFGVCPASVLGRSDGVPPPAIDE